MKDCSERGSLGITIALLYYCVVYTCNASFQAPYGVIVVDFQLFSSSGMRIFANKSYCDMVKCFSAQV